MTVIVGLGNPGREYEGTRHNAGFETLDILADDLGVGITAFEKHALIGKAMLGGEKLMLVKPQTFMNLSGIAVRALLDYYGLTAEDLIVIYDDISLEPGRIRIRGAGSHGGHNGIKNIVSELGTEQFRRIRIGVGDKPPKWDLADWVLSKPQTEEKQKMYEAMERACDAVRSLLEDGLESTMNKFNG